MGKAGRWLRSLLSGKNPVSESPVKQKRRWGFGRSTRLREKAPPLTAVEKRVVSFGECGAARRCDDDKLVERNQRAIEVALATAAVAEAAVSAAHAAASVVRMTSRSRSTGAATFWKEEWAATRIQAAFRGYLARKASRALKGLVKLQALVRGHLVRKKAAHILRCMQALVRVQARARAQRLMNQYHHSYSSQSLGGNHSQGPDTPEKYEPWAPVNRTRSERAPSASKSAGTSPCCDSSLKQKHRVKSKRAEARLDLLGPWSWLDRWIDGRSGGPADSGKANDTKIVGVDPGKAPFTTKCKNKPHSSRSINSTHNLSLATPLTASMDSTVMQFSSLSSPSVDMPSRYRTGHGSGNGITRTVPVPQPWPLEYYSQTELGGCIDCPNYMANTESWRAKARSQSAPKQRPATLMEKCSTGRRVPPSEPVDARSNVSRALSQRSSSSSLHSKFASKAYPGSGRLDRLPVPPPDGGDNGGCKNQ